MKFSKIQIAAAAVVLGAMLAAPAYAGKTVDAIKAKVSAITFMCVSLGGSDDAVTWSVHLKINN